MLIYLRTVLASLFALISSALQVYLVALLSGLSLALRQSFTISRCLSVYYPAERH